MSEFENDSRELVPPQGDAKGFDKRYQEKWLIYCPAIASDTLLLFVTALESYSLRSYGGRLGIKATGMHAEGAHTTSEFMRMYSSDKAGDAERFELAVTKKKQWAETITEQWLRYRKSHGMV